MIVGTESLYNEAKESLERIQQFDTSGLPQETELGAKLNFADAVEPAQLLIDLYKRLSISALEDFPDPVLTTIKDNANNHYNIFKQILDFNPEQQSPHNARNSLISSIKSAFQPAFQALHQYISYSLHRSADFQRLDSQARATLQSIEDKAQKISKNLMEYENNAKSALSEIRKVAEEEGVTQQASHFRTESDHHETESNKWKSITIKLSYAIGAFAVLSIFLHKIPFIKPETTYDTIQLAISKLLIFSVMSYMLFLSAKNFLSHKHNAIVNKHRQNALMTHKALIEASGIDGVRDAVLLQASSCIYSPQPTGYISSGVENDVSSQKSFVEIVSKPLTQALKEVNK